MMFFMRFVIMHIVSMWWFFIHVVSMWWFLWELLLLKVFFNMKRYYAYVWWRVKMCEFCRYAFWRDFKYNQYNYFFSIERDCESIFRFVSILFKCDFNVIISLVWWGSGRCLGVWVKIFGFCEYAFL